MTDYGSRRNKRPDSRTMWEESETRSSGRDRNDRNDRHDIAGSDRVRRAPDRHRDDWDSNRYDPRHNGGRDSRTRRYRSRSRSRQRYDRYRSPSPRKPNKDRGPADRSRDWDREKDIGRDRRDRASVRDHHYHTPASRDARGGVAERRVRDETENWDHDRDRERPSRRRDLDSDRRGGDKRDTPRRSTSPRPAPSTYDGSRRAADYAAPDPKSELPSTQQHNNIPTRPKQAYGKANNRLSSNSRPEHGHSTSTAPVSFKVGSAGLDRRDSAQGRSRSHARHLSSNGGKQRAGSETRMNEDHDMDRPDADMQEAENDDVVVEDDDMAAMKAMMGFEGFDTTKNKKVIGNNVGAVWKEKKTEYRQYMNRIGGFNRPLSPTR